jgi:hypothetical protein
MNVKEEIELLKSRINVELNSFNYHKELKSIVEVLKKQVNDYDYNDLDEFELLKYKAYLEVFIDFNIKKINDMFKNTNRSIYNNTSADLLKKINHAEEEIEAVIIYLKSNLPSIGIEADEDYKKLKDMYYSHLEDTLKFNKSCFYQDLGIPSDYSLSVYGSTDTLFKAYMHKLDIYKSMHINKLEKFMYNDIKIKETIQNAKKMFNNTEAYEYVVKLENNYLDNLNKSMKDYDAFKESDVIRLQEEMINRSLSLDNIVENQRKYNEYYEYLNNISLKEYDENKLLEIYNFLDDNSSLSNLYYEVLYTIVEKDKYLKEKYNFDTGFINKLNDKILLNLEKRYVDRLSLLNDEELNNSLKEYKEKGYLGVLDKETKEILDQLNIINLPELVTEDIKGDKNADCDLTIDKCIEKIKEKEASLPKKFLRKVTPGHAKIIELQNGRINKISDDLYRVTVSDSGNCYYFDSEGNNISKYPLSLSFDKHISNFLLEDKYSETKPKVIYDSNGVKKFEIPPCNDLKISVDNVSGNALLLSKNVGCLYRCDKDGNLLDNIKIKDFYELNNRKFDDKYSDIELDTFHDNIVTVKLQNSYFGDDSMVMYYDFEKKEPLYSFNSYSASGVAFNDGLFPFKEKYKYGFMNKKGEVVIKPKYSNVSCFAGDLAYVFDTDESKDHGHFIDKFGNDVPYSYSILIEQFNTDKQIKPSVKLDRQRYIKNFKEVEMYYSKNNLFIDSDKKIVDLINNKEEEKVLVK